MEYPVINDRWGPEKATPTISKKSGAHSRSFFRYRDNYSAGISVFGLCFPHKAVTCRYVFADQTFNNALDVAVDRFFRF